MDNFIKDVNECIDSVVMANMIAGKYKVAYTEQELDNQDQRVDEETKELFDDIAPLMNGNHSQEMMIRFMDHICDIAVTESFRCVMDDPDFVVKNLTELYGNYGEFEVLNEFLTRFNSPVERLQHILGAMKTIQDSPILVKCEKFDIIGAWNAVNENNLSKFIPVNSDNIEEIIEKTYEKYKGDKTITHVYSHGHVVFKDVTDDKYLKPHGFVSVDLSPFVVVL